jgi:phosphoribosylaminoimidazole-succinocarboxamide synthase
MADHPRVKNEGLSLKVQEILQDYLKKVNIILVGLKLS